MAKRILRIAAVGAATTVAVGGMALAVAAPASAAPIKGKITISAPASVNAGSVVTIKCQAKKELRGQRVWFKEQGAAFHASRVVSNNGNCIMKVYTELKGMHTFFMKSSKNGQVYKSNVVKIRVNYSSARSLRRDKLWLSLD